MINQRCTRNILGVLCCVVIAVFAGALPHTAHAATNISAVPTDHWAWNDLIGWIDFYGTDTVIVNSWTLAGYASSSVGDISFDCHTTRSGDICGTSNYQVTNNGLGDLSGWGWNDTYGWISFCGRTSGGTPDCPTTPYSYRVWIDPSTGTFGSSLDYAWNDVIGWISFNCTNHGGCGTSNYKVVTSWIATSTSGIAESTTFDTGVVTGAQLNSVLWHGNQPGGTSVRFQFAVSNSPTGPWNFMGPDGTSASIYTATIDTSRKLDYTFHNGGRYFRYRVMLVSDQAQTVSPRVDDVIVNWSP